MKVYKYTAYYFDFEDFGKSIFNNILDKSNICARIFYEGEAEIGDWSDDHELNYFKSDQLTFDKYFEK